jgi:hypothetical protein
MQNDTSQFVVNIIPLQNIQSNTSGEDATTILTNSVANIQQMVNFEQKRIYTDYLSAYTADGTIQVLSPMNMSDVPLTGNITGSNLNIIGSGTFTGTVSASGFVTLSDVLAKKNVLPIQGSVLEGFQRIQPYYYQYKPEFTSQNEEGEPEIGLLAQEIEAVFPEAISVRSDGRKYVKYNAIVALLVGAVKELAKRC